jgi:hypothetical protein
LLAQVAHSPELTHRRRSVRPVNRCRATALGAQWDSKRAARTGAGSERAEAADQGAAVPAAVAVREGRAAAVAQEGRAAAAVREGRAAAVAQEGRAAAAVREGRAAAGLMLASVAVSSEGPGRSALASTARRRTPQRATARSSAPESAAPCLVGRAPNPTATAISGRVVRARGRAPATWPFPGQRRHVAARPAAPTPRRASAMPRRLPAPRRMCRCPSAACRGSLASQLRTLSP